MLSKKDRKRILEVASRFGIALDKGNMELFQSDCTLILMDGRPFFFMYNDVWYPTLHAFQRGSAIPAVWVDDGAVKHILNGADIFAPGIVKHDSFEEGAPVIVLHENTLLSLGIALGSSEEIKPGLKGKIIKNIHYYGDGIFRCL